MGRARPQGTRRQQIVSAALACALDRGLFDLRVQDVAQRLGITGGAVLYYFPTLDDLRLEVYRQATETWFSSREVPMLPSATEHLLALIASGLPADLPAEAQLIDEPLAGTRTKQAFREVAGSLFHREVARYRSVLDRGKASAEFTLAGESLDLARNLVSLEESYRNHIITGDPSITREVGLRLLTSYGAMATGRQLALPTH